MTNDHNYHVYKEIANATYKLAGYTELQKRAERLAWPGRSERKWKQ